MNTLTATGAVGSAPTGSVQQANEDVTTAQGELDAGITAIASLNAAVSAADATIADLKKRIKRHDDELAELRTLVTADGKGTLDKAAA